MRVKRIYIGEGKWVEPVARWGECDHPRAYLRFDPRYALPVACYCCACGKARIHPFHGMSEAEIAEARAKGAELHAKLNAGAES